MNVVSVDVIVKDDVGGIRREKTIRRCSDYESSAAGPPPILKELAVCAVLWKYGMVASLAADRPDVDRGIALVGDASAPHRESGSSEGAECQ